MSEPTALEMQRWGDEMQSEASRLAASVEHDSLPYEAQIALVAVESLVDDWTRLRSDAARQEGTEQ